MVVKGDQTGFINIKINDINIKTGNINILLLGKEKLSVANYQLLYIKRYK